MSIEKGILWVVATPIGNFDDISSRALSVLKEVDWVAAEDTRHSGVLLNHFGLKKPMISCHEHNEGERAKQLIAKLANGEQGAIISDAGTPLISDPGYRLVSLARAEGVNVKVVPGPSSVVAALSVAGLPTNTFQFLGFLPAKVKAKQAVINSITKRNQTTVVFESVHRLLDTAKQLDDFLPDGSDIFMARELTKQFEETALLKAGNVVEWLASDSYRLKGEYVIVISVNDGAAEASQKGHDVDVDVMIDALLDEGVSTKSIAASLSKSLGLNKKALYQQVIDKVHAS